ncbi:MAG: hypothetical protein HY608_05860 [Planctomycetes bacterium]|nr:hypothetical protein [Planctomycetota bacterium]
MAQPWFHLTWDQVCRRAGGRRRYRRWQRVVSVDRQIRALRLVVERGGLHVRGVQAAVAREIGVHRSTVCRYVRSCLLPEDPHARRRTEAWRAILRMGRRPVGDVSRVGPSVGRDVRGAQ